MYLYQLARIPLDLLYSPPLLQSLIPLQPYNPKNFQTFQTLQTLQTLQTHKTRNTERWTQHNVTCLSRVLSCSLVVP